MTVFNIVTPCRNAGRLLGETIESVLNQSALRSGLARLRYWVVDGASEDRTLEVARAYLDRGITLISEPDAGMYDALAKGLRGIDDGICAYLNAGDLYAEHAFSTVQEIFAAGRVPWLTGLEVAHNENGQVIHAHLPFRYRRRLFQCGAYGRLLPFVQQESTFWDARLHAHLDLERLRRFRFAGDYFLWHTFCQFAELRIVEAQLGGFRVHSGQTSQVHMKEYLKEMAGFCRRPNPADYAVALADRLCWEAPVRWKKALNRSGLLRYDHARREWV